MPIQENCRILEHQKVGPQHFKLTLASSYIASHAEPGQFVNVRCADGCDPLLRRPFSFHRISKERDTFDLLYDVHGWGTEALTKFFVGEEINVLGPLGKGFVIDPQKQIHILVGGGMGIAPLLSLANHLTSYNLELRTAKALYVLMGAKDKAHVLEETSFRKITDQVMISTDDGSYGKKGFISDLLLDFLNNQLTTYDLQLTTVYACGPRPMLKAVAEITAQKKIDCQVSMEERMACGIGACKGCATKTTSGYQTVCRHGPVFKAEEIVW